MRYEKIAICLFSAFLLAAAVYMGTKEAEQHDALSLSVRILADGGAEEITCWQNEEGEAYFFLPSYAELSRVYIQTNTRHAVCLDGQRLVDGMSCEAFQLNIPYDLSYTTGNGAYHFSLTFVQSAQMPAMYIDVSSGSMDYLHQDKNNKESGSIRLYTANGTQDYNGNLASIKTRGNGTWHWPKKPYSLKLASEANLLGMGEAQRWILLSNGYDSSHLRNKIAYDFAAAMGGMPYSP